MDDWPRIFEPNCCNKMKHKYKAVFAVSEKYNLRGKFMLILFCSLLDRLNSNTYCYISIRSNLFVFAHRTNWWREYFKNSIPAANRENV